MKKIINFAFGILSLLVVFDFFLYPIIIRGLSDREIMLLMGVVGMFLWFRWMIMDIKGFFLAMGRDIDAEIEEDNKVIDVAVRAHFNENKEAAVVDKAS